MIRQISVDGLIECPEFPALLQEYADECPPKSGMPHTYNKATYKALEESGALQSFGAFGEDEELLGFVTVIITMLPKYTSLSGGGRLAEVMPKSGYEESDIIFFKGLK